MLFAVPVILAPVIPPLPFTVLIVIVALLAGFAPPSCVPGILNVSFAKYPDPTVSTVTLYVAPVLFTVNAALEPPTVSVVYAGLT